MVTLNFSKSLLVNPPFADMIVSGLKKIECRSKSTNVRGKIGIMQTGTNSIIGTADIVGCFKMTPSQAKDLFNLHRVKNLSLLEKWCWAWELSNQVKFKEPIPYKPRRGAIVWVRH